MRGCRTTGDDFIRIPFELGQEFKHVIVYNGVIVEGQLNEFHVGIFKIKWDILRGFLNLPISISENII
jgi:hypothetical protein